MEILKEFKIELKEIKESHQIEKDELKSQISIENLQRRSAEDEILKLKSEYQSIINNLEAEITRKDVNFKINQERLQEFKEKIDFLQVENGKLKESKEEMNLSVVRVKKDLEKAEREKIQLFSDCQVLQSKCSDAVTNFETSNSSILSVKKLVEQASNMYFPPFII